jgi:hypothetical protein
MHIRIRNIVTKIQRLLVAGLLAFTLGLPVAASAARVSFDMVPDDAGTDMTNAVSMSFEATLYPVGWWFDQIEAKLYTPAPDEAFVIDALRINKTGTAQDIKNLWLPEDQADIAAVVANINSLKANQTFLANVQNSTFQAKILYGAYTIFLVQHSHATLGQIVNFYTLKQVAGKYYLTNYLKSDNVLKVLLNKYKPTLALKVR